MTIMSAVAVCTAAAALLAISAARQLLTDGTKTPERMAAATFHCEHVAQWARTAPLSPAQAFEALERCEASPPPMAMNLGWELLLRLDIR